MANGEEARDKATEALALIVGRMMHDASFLPMERKLVLWQLSLETSSFRITLWQVLFRADSENLARIEKGFPDEVAALRAWLHGDLAQRARALGLEV